MKKLTFSTDGEKGQGLKILCLGAHCDDIEIGCGGTLLTLIEKYRIDEIYWIVFCSNETRKTEARKSAGRFLEDVGKKTVIVHSFKDGYMPDQWSDIKDSFEELKHLINPDLIFTHTRDDRHQDHRQVHNFTWNTFRSHTILEYEIPKYDGDFGSPNLFVPISREIAEAKIEITKEAFKSQAGKQWFDDELFLGLMRIRGMECVAESNYAEGFYVRKVTIE